MDVKIVNQLPSKLGSKNIYGNSKSEEVKLDPSYFARKITLNELENVVQMLSGEKRPLAEKYAKYLRKLFRWSNTL